MRSAHVLPLAHVVFPRVYASAPMAGVRLLSAFCSGTPHTRATATLAQLQDTLPQDVIKHTATSLQRIRTRSKMIISSHLSLGLTVSVLVSLCGASSTFEDAGFGPINVKAIKVENAELSAAQHTVLVKLGSSAWPEVKITDVDEHITFNEVVSWIDCGIDTSNIGGDTKLAKLKFTQGHTFDENKNVCLNNLNAVFEKRHYLAILPESNGVSWLDTLVDKLSSIVPITAEGDNKNDQDKMIRHYKSIFQAIKAWSAGDHLEAHARFIWASGAARINTLITKKNFDEAESLLMSGFVIPDSLRVFAGLVKTGHNVELEETSKLLFTLSTEELLMLACWPKLTEENINAIVKVIDNRPLTLQNQRGWSSVTVSNMYAIGQLYALEKAGQDARSPLSFVRFLVISSKLDQLKDQQLKNIIKITYDNIVLMQNFLGTSKTDFDDYSNAWRQLAASKGFDSTNFDHIKQAFEKTNLSVSGTLNAAAAVPGKITIETTMSVITDLVDNAKFEVVHSYLKATAWDKLSSADKYTLVRLMDHQYISPAFVYNMAVTGTSATAKLVYAALSADPILNVAHVSSAAIKKMMAESGADAGILKIKGDFPNADSENTKVTKSICDAFNNEAAWKAKFTTLKLNNVATYELVASSMAVKLEGAEPQISDAVSQKLKTYIQECPFKYALYQSFVNGGMWPTCIEWQDNISDIVTGMYFMSTGPTIPVDGDKIKKQFLSVHNALNNSSEKEFNINMLNPLQGRKSVQLLELPEIGSAKGTSTLTYVLYILLLVVCISVAVIGARILIADDSDRRSSTSSAESRDIEAGTSATDPKQESSTSNDTAGRSGESASDEAVPEKSQV